SFHDEGDHAVWVGEVSRVAVEPGPPLLHYAGRYRGLAPAADAGKPGSDRLQRRVERPPFPRQDPRTKERGKEQKGRPPSKPMAENVLMPEMSWTEVEHSLKDRPIALLPVGNTEAHGPHLPIATDTVIAIEMARRTAVK